MITVALVHDETLNRVRVTAAGLDPDAVTARVERKLAEATDHTYVLVRGGGEDQVRLMDSDESPPSKRDFAVPVDDYEFPEGEELTYRVTSFDADGEILDQDADEIEVSFGEIWLKSISKPFLNRPVVVTDHSAVERLSRTTFFPIVGRQLVVAVSDVRLGRQFTLELRTSADEDNRALDRILDSGEPAFLHVPSGCPVPGGHWSIGETVEERRSTRGPLRYPMLPLIEVAAPAPAIVGTTATWSTVVHTYDSWDDLAADNDRWADVLQIVGEPGNVLPL